MHKSRLGCVVIDCEGDTYDQALSFWSSALGRQTAQSDDLYTRLDTAHDDYEIILQRVDHESRVHLDIESDDIDAEAERLEALGAKRLKKVKGWWVMEAPTGHRFCIVKPQQDDFYGRANRWE
ncbi:MAG: VOC family protein [Pseudomonadota bacterium]